MKRITCIYFLLIITIDVMAQFDVSDRNWRLVLDEEFVGNSWNYSQWLLKNNQGVPVWRAYMSEWPSGVARDNKLSVYQRSALKLPGIPPMDTVLKIVDTLVSLTPLQCLVDYSLPPFKQCDTSSNIPPLYYYSGNIESLEKFRFGYFEIRCKLPVHPGSCAAFWLFGNSQITYEEIDIFEYSKDDYAEDELRGFSNGIWYNPSSTNYSQQLDPIHYAHNYAKTHVHIPLTDPPVYQWHTYACEWFPEYIKWYCDGVLVNECHEWDQIPKRGSKTVKINYAIDPNALDDETHSISWNGGGIMGIDYIRVYQLEWDCYTETVISSNQNLEDYDFKVKGSVVIDSALEEVTVDSNDKVTFRVVDGFTIDGPFSASLGGEMTVILHTCPKYY